jgi:hypothetical protein
MAEKNDNHLQPRITEGSVVRQGPFLLLKTKFMARIKGSKKTGGRKKGTINKVTSDIKKMIIEALNNSGGVSYLEKQAAVNPRAFMGLIGKVLPLTLSGDPESPLNHNVSITITPVKPR